MTPQDAPRLIVPRFDEWVAELRPARRWWRDGFDVHIVVRRPVSESSTMTLDMGSIGWRRTREAARTLARLDLAERAARRADPPRAVEVVRTPPIPRRPSPTR